jgi:hypothetical protein
MTIGTIYIDGFAYHSRLSEYNDALGWYEKEEPIYEQMEFFGGEVVEGLMIPKTSCLCFAHSSSECCCGAWDYTQYMEE